MPTNWIANGTFDNTGSWTLLYGNGSSGVYIDTVNHDLVMDGLAWPDTQEANSADFPTAAGVTYTVTFDLKEQNSGGGHSNTNFTMGLLLFSDAGPNAGNGSIFAEITPTFDATWHTYSATFVGTGVESYLEFNNAIGANQATIDNVSVVANTPPVGLALQVDSGISDTDNITNDSTIVGVADPSTAVTLTEAATTLATLTSDANGLWTYAPSFVDGTYTLTASETNTSSVTGTATLAFTLDTAPPPVPTVALVDDTGVSSTDHITSDPALVGTAEAGDVITILAGGTTLDVETANASGTWSSSPSFSDGVYTLTIEAENAAGNVASTTFSLTVDTTPPSPTVQLVNDTGASNSDGLTYDPAITGTAEPGDVVTVLNGGTTLGAATANASGTWTYTPSLADNSYTLTASEADVAGNVGTNTVSFTLETVPQPVSIGLPDDTGVSSTDHITSDPTVAGSAEADSTITITNGATVVGGTSADGSGNWSTTPSLPDGSYNLTVLAVDQAGLTATNTISFQLETVAPPVTVQLVDDTGVSNSDRITSNPALTGTAQAGSTITIVDDGGTTYGSTTAGVSGTWSFTPALSDGSYVLTAMEQSLAGNTATATLSITEDATAPSVTAAIVNVTDSGITTTDPSIAGTADPGSVVTIAHGATVLGTATADGGGSWGFTLALPNGDYTLAASETDIAGVVGTATMEIILEGQVVPFTAVLTSDTGASSSDGITSDPAISGTAAADSVMTITNGSTDLGTVTADGSGSWSFTPILADGSYTLTASEAIPGGGSGSTTLSFTLETTAPPVSATLVSDTGVSASDHITSNPALTGTAEAGSVITITNGATVLGTTTTGVSGTWGFTPTLANGSHTLTASELTLAGNTATTTLALTLETTAVTPTAALVDDTGVSASDHITSNQALTGTAEAGSVVTITNGATVLGTTTAGISGTWNFTPTLVDGSYTLTASELTLAGNTASTTLAITLETTAPTPTAVLVDDTGISASDHITSDPALTGTAAPGSLVRISNGATVLGTSTTGISGTWSFTPTLADGSYTLTAAELTLAGNTASTTLALTLDTVVPVVTVALVADTGISSTDHITSDEALAGTAQADSVVTIRNGATILGTATADVSGTWNFTPTLADGSYTLTAAETDIAGNLGTATINFTYEVAATAPTAALVSDTGISASDHITSDAALTGTAEAGSVITISNGATALGTVTTGINGTWSFTPTIADGSYTLTASELTLAGNTASTTLALTLATSVVAPTATLVDDTGISASDHITSDPAITGIAGAGSIVTIRNGATVLGTATAGISGTWSFTPTIADGSYTLTASETDIAGNIGSTTLALTLETTAPPVTVALVADTGVSSSDHITSDPAITGSAGVGSVVTITNGGTVLGTVTANGSGVWSFTPTLADGTYTLTASELTRVGNIGSNTLSFTLDATVPIVTEALVSDTGASASDGITSNPALTGIADASSVVTITNGATVIGTTTAGINGTWSFTPTLANGSYTLTASETDTAGNTGTATLAVTQETTAPVPTAALVADTGVSSSDHITSNQALTGSAAVGSIITVRNGATVLGTVTTGASGTWNFTPTLADGSYTLTASELTLAGNTASTTLALTLETTAPTPTAILVDDTGISAADHITSDPALTGTAAPGSLVRITNGATVLGTATTGVSGTWSFTPTLADGSYTLTAAELTLAGNTASTTLALTLEATVAAPGALTLTPSSDSGVLGDHITNVVTPVITGTGVAGDTITLYNGVVQIGSGTVGQNGTWSITSATLAGGSHNLHAIQSDIAGNVSGSSTLLALTIDTAIPSTPTLLLLAPASDSGVVGDDITNVNTPAITGSGTAGDTVTLYDGSSAVGTATVGIAGTWSVTASLLADGNHTLTATETDVAGNASAHSAALVVTIDTTAPAAPTLGEAVATTNPAAPVIDGTAETGSTVLLSQNGTTIGTITAVAGTWNFDYQSALAAGSYTLTATATDSAGNVSAVSAPLTLQVNSNNSYAVVTPVPDTDTTKSYVYNPAGVLTTVQTNGGQDQLLTSVTNVQAVINIYDTAGTLIGTITQPSTSAFSQPVFATTPNTLAASTGSGPIGSVVDLLSENNNFVSQGNDTITVHSGTAMITATGPSTVVNNDSANVTFYGGAGTATVNGGSGTVIALGGAGGGTLTGGTAGNNVLAAGGGITTVNGVANGDMLFGSSTNTGIDTLVAGAGTETLVGGAGTETLDANTGDTAFGGSGTSTLNGGPNGGSTLVGGSGTSTLVAGGGPESMWAGSGNSTLQGGSGPDIMGGNADINSTTLMIGGTGDATFLGYGGTVTAMGGSGNDTFWTGTGAMTITEGAGNDSVIFGSGHAMVTGGTGTDLYTFISGQAGGTDLIANFQVGVDQLQLFGYDMANVQSQVIGANTVLSFADNTSVTLLGVTHLAASSIVG